MRKVNLSGLKTGIVLAVIGSLETSAQSFYEKLDAVAVENKLIGMSVAVVCHGTVADVHHYGLSDIPRSIPVTDSTMYRVASISKSVTASALMKLFEQGYFSLDENISDYLGFNVYNPNYPAEPITFRMILSHTSGLQDGTGYNYFLQATANQTPPPPIASLLVPGGTFYTADMWLPKHPGAWFNYANINFGVAATLIEQISGIRFDIYTRDSILLPLGIKGSFNVNDIGNINNVAVLYRNSIPQADNYQGIPPTPVNLTGYIIGTNGMIFSPQGGLRISALDLCKFMVMQAQQGIVNNTRILDSSTVALMHSIQWDYNGVNGNNYHNLFRRWGLGFHLTTNAPGGDIVFEGVPMIGHPGEAYGLISDMYFEKDKIFGLVFITNGYSGTTGYIPGNYSAFYLPEEAVFTAIRDDHFTACFPVSANNSSAIYQQVSPWYNRTNNTLQFPGIKADGLLTVFNVQGGIIFQSELSGNKIRIQDIPMGLYMYTLRLTTGVIHGKFIR
jgi:CubicO group peptidase (beta-lactamase class C family)